MTQKAWPTEIRLAKDRKTLTVSFEGGQTHDYPAEYLRVKSPSAEVQGHSPADRQTVPGKINVQILSVEPIGNYAIRLTFDDMHSTGIFTWDYFVELAEHRQAYWQSYLDELKDKGLSRETR